MDRPVSASTTLPGYRDFVQPARKCLDRWRWRDRPHRRDEPIVPVSEVPDPGFPGHHARPHLFPRAQCVAVRGTEPPRVPPPRCSSNSCPSRTCVRRENRPLRAERPDGPHPFPGLLGSQRIRSGHPCRGGRIFSPDRNLFAFLQNLTTKLLSVSGEYPGTWGSQSHAVSSSGGDQL